MSLLCHDTEFIIFSRNERNMQPGCRRSVKMQHSIGWQSMMLVFEHQLNAVGTREKVRRSQPLEGP